MNVLTDPYLWLIAGALVSGAATAVLFLRGTGFGAHVDGVLARAPFPVWAEKDGAVVWRNRACRTVFGTGRFGGLSTLDPKPFGRGSDTRIVEVSQGDASPDFFSLVEQKFATRSVIYALDAAPLVEAESELRRFVQTLTTTFAHLPIGLAVFDRKRDLTLFNPALSDLLGVAPDWLARRPSLAAFLDRLRNDGALPEPKDYSSLRQEFQALEQGSFEGYYEVEWTLPNGRLYRVTGRPHSEGGAALLFEDITRTASLEAHYRAEMRQLHGALESLTDGVAIFDAAGEMAYANDAFDALWNCTLSRSVQPVSVTDVSKLFQDQCRPHPAFGEMRDFVLNLQERSDWQATVERTCGDFVRMNFTPISEGRVICEFRREWAQDRHPKLVRSG